MHRNTTFIKRLRKREKLLKRRGRNNMMNKKRKLRED